MALRCWGDSLTSGWAGQTPWPTQLSGLGLANTNHGVVGETSTEVRTRFFATYATRLDPSIIWVGRNNVTEPATILADIQACVAAMGHTAYLVLGVTNRRDEGVGTANLQTITTLNATLATRYGRRFVDVCALLAAAASGPEDAQDVAAKIPPRSQMIDLQHMSSAGYATIARAVWERREWLELVQRRPASVIVG